MRLKSLIDEDFVNYKEAAMFIGTIKCGGKCCIEAGIPLTVCQNDTWRNAPIVEMDTEELCHRYLDNVLTSAIVIGGLEPFEQFDEIREFVHLMRTKFNCDDDIVIYTGYNQDEIKMMLDVLSRYKNIVVKFGRYIPNRESRFDEVLGITLASDNQYAVRLVYIPPMKIIINPDSELVSDIRSQLKDNDGYCPCQLDKTPDTKCMCKEFRESTEPGECHCGLYVKIVE